MDPTKLVQVLKATLVPDNREEAEKELTEVHKIIGFAPILLQIVMSDQVEMPVRQAGVIYLKNMIMQYWHEREIENPADPVPFHIHEQDRANIRNHMVEAVISAPDAVRVQLVVSISHIIKHDFPGRWPGIAEKVGMYIQSDNHSTWLGALLCLHQLIKNYEFKKNEERGPLNQAMQVLLPLIYQRAVQLLPDQSELSVLIQKQILKCYYALIQFCLPLDLIPREMFSQWMELVGQIVDLPVPEATNQIDEDDRPELAWWKVKKWALHILARTFERYGSPGNVTKEYQKFSEWYLKSFSGGILLVLLKVLDQFRQNIYVAPRVVQQTLNYLNQAVSHAASWTFLKQHMQGIIQEVLFPLMCHNDDDEDLWQADPIEYIRTKYDVFEEFLSPTTAAQTLLHNAVVKRKQVLQKTMGFCRQILNQASVEPRHKDGALHIIGAIADVLLKKKIYKDQVETMLVTHVFPEFQSQHGFLRARACWVLHYFCEVKFKSPANLAIAIESTKNCLLNDKELPVKVEASIGLQMLITEQEKAKDLVRPNVDPIVMELLNIIRETENDDMTTVLQKIACTFIEEITPKVIHMTSHLADTFTQILQSDTDGSDDKAVAAMGILNTIETLLTIMEDQKEILAKLEDIVLNVIGTTFNHNVLEFYEEILSLVYILTTQQISSRLWQVFDMIYNMFQNDGFDYFTDMMPALHNYVTVDPQMFMSDPKYIEVIYNMCKAVLVGDAGEDAENHAVKLLEVIILQYKGKIDQLIPTFVQLALERLTREIKTSELRTMCLQVIIAALYYNPPLLLEILENIHLPNTTESVTGQFVKQWLHDCDAFLGLHDRRVCMLGLCAIIDTPPTRPKAINDVASQILPASIMIFSGLKRAYEGRANDADGDSDAETDEEYDPDVLDDDEDDIDDDAQEYLEKLEKVGNDEDDDDDDDYDDEAEETALESYLTPLDDDESEVDEYQIFKNLLQTVQVRDPAWYNSLTSGLTKEQQAKLQEVSMLADQRKAAQDSKRIEKGGGFVFSSTAVPQTFNFGGQ